MVLDLYRHAALAADYALDSDAGDAVFRPLRRPQRPPAGEIALNPGFAIDLDGNVTLPE